MSSTFFTDPANAIVGGTSFRAQAAVVADTNGTGVDFLTSDGPVTMIVSAGDIDTANADETYTVKVQESADNSTNWTDVTGFSTTVTADNQDKIVTNSKRTKRYLRAVIDVGGTTPSFLGSVYLFSRKKITGTGAGAYTAT